MALLIQIIHSISAILLIIAIITQEKGSGLSAAIGGANMSFQPTKRGPEKVLHYFTVVMVVLFLLSSVAYLFA